MDKSLLIAHIDSSKENSTTAVLRLIGSNSSGIGMTNIKQLKMCGNSAFTYPEHAMSICSNRLRIIYPTKRSGETSEYHS